MEEINPHLGHPWLEWAKEIRAMAQIALTYSKDPFEIERATRLQEIALQMMGQYVDYPITTIARHFLLDAGYPTPKIDVRVALFRGDKILLVREKQDGCWAMPGGWCDIGTSPSEAARQEVAQEAGLAIEIRRLLALHDKAKHPHPPHIDYTYKIFFEGEILGPSNMTIHETDGIEYFPQDNLPPLSLPRTLPEQVEMVFRLRGQINSVEFD